MFSTRRLTLSFGRIFRNQFSRDLTSNEVVPDAEKDGIVEKSEGRRIQ